MSNGVISICISLHLKRELPSSGTWTIVNFLEVAVLQKLQCQQIVRFFLQKRRVTLVRPYLNLSLRFIFSVVIWRIWWKQSNLVDLSGANFAETSNQNAVGSE